MPGKIIFSDAPITRNAQVFAEWNNCRHSNFYQDRHQKGNGYEQILFCFGDNDVDKLSQDSSNKRLGEYDGHAAKILNSPTAEEYARICEEENIHNQRYDVSYPHDMPLDSDFDRFYPPSAFGFVTRFRNGVPSLEEYKAATRKYFDQILLNLKNDGIVIIPFDFSNNKTTIGTDGDYSFERDFPDHFKILNDQINALKEVENVASEEVKKDEDQTIIQNLRKHIIRGPEEIKETSKPKMESDSTANIHHSKKDEPKTKNISMIQKVKRFVVAIFKTFFPEPKLITNNSRQTIKTPYKEEEITSEDRSIRIRSASKVAQNDQCTRQR